MGNTVRGFISRDGSSRTAKPCTPVQFWSWPPLLAFDLFHLFHLFQARWVPAIRARLWSRARLPASASRRAMPAMPAHGGQGTLAILAVNQAENELQHDRPHRLIEVFDNGAGLRETTMERL